MILYKTKNFIDAGTLAGSALAIGGLTANIAFINSMKGDMDSRKNEKTSKRFRDQLVTAFRKKNGDNNFLEIKDLDNACAVQIENVDEVRKNIEELSPEDKKELEEVEKTDPLVHGILEVIRKSNLDNPVIIADPNFNDPAVISHEVGHTEYQTKEENGRNKFIKFAHKYPAYFNDGGLLWGGLFGFILGIAKNANSVTGTKVANYAKNGAFVMATVDAGMVLTCELAASRRGIELLKKLGASDDDIRRYRKTLLKAAGSYVAYSTMNVGLMMLGIKIGKYLANR